MIRRSLPLQVVPLELCLFFVAALIASGCGVSRTSSPPVGGSGPTSAECSTGDLYTFKNNNAYPVWLAEAYQGGGDLNSNIILPPENNWMMATGTSVDLCMPAGWSGRFWPRTECNFTTAYSNDPGYKSCTAASQCGSGHVCFGGKCMLDCTSGKTPFCQGETGLNNQNAVCVESGYAGAAHFCSYPQGTVCKTGDCQGLYQCYGQWDANAARYGASGPVALFEPTSNSVTDVNYDISLVSGYNSQIQVMPSVPVPPDHPATCYAPGCTSDLNQGCPANLEVTEAPTT